MKAAVDSSHTEAGLASLPPPFAVAVVDVADTHPGPIPISFLVLAQGSPHAIQFPFESFRISKVPPLVREGPQGIQQQWRGSEVLHLQHP